MSIRSQAPDDSYADAVRRDLSDLKTTALEASRLDNLDASVKPEGHEAAAAYDALEVHEQAAASLGVHPDSLRPIGFLNAGHYESLKKSNALSDDLARRIEVRFAVTTPRNLNAALTPLPFSHRRTRSSRPRRSERVRARVRVRGDGSARVNKKLFTLRLVAGLVAEVAVVVGGGLDRCGSGDGSGCGGGSGGGDSVF